MAENGAANERLIWIDLEMTGLDTDNDSIIEIATVVTDAQRGSILDRNGDELVGNRPALTITAERQQPLDPGGVPGDEDAPQKEESS